MKRFIQTLIWLTFVPFILTAQTSVQSIAEQMPEYPGGLDSLMKEIAGKVVYPKQCADSNIQGKVFIRFIVNEDGSISNTEAIKGPHPLLNTAAIEAVKTIKKFKPATDKGKVVRVWYSLPVNFKIKQVVPPTLPLPSELIKITDPALLDTLNNEFNWSDTIFTIVDEPAEFPGGDRELMRFLQRNINYPQLERDNDIQGKVLIKFVVNEDGNVTDINVIQSASPGLDKEALRVIGLLPRFIPATRQGKPVKVYFNIPVIFRLGDGYSGQTSRVDLFQFYPGGYEAFSKFLYDNLIYPPAAVSSNTEAVIYLNCKLNQALHLDTIHIFNDLDSIFTGEVIRLIKAFPAFSEKANPSAMQEEYTLEIIFSLDKKYVRRTTGGPDAIAANRLSIEGSEYFKQGKLSKALEYYDAAIRYYSLHSEAYYNRALAKLKLNDKAGACDDFRRSYLLGTVDAMSAIKQTCK